MVLGSVLFNDIVLFEIIVYTFAVLPGYTNYC